VAFVLGHAVDIIVSNELPRGVLSRQELRMVFNSNLPVKLEFQVGVEDQFAQKSIDVYRGFVQLFTDSSQAYQTPSFSSDSRTRTNAGKVYSIAYSIFSNGTLLLRKNYHYVDSVA